MRPMNRGLEDADRFVAQQEAAEAMSPTVSKAWLEGEAAGLTRTSNCPYSAWSVECQEWWKGFNAGVRGVPYDFKAGQPMSQKQFETEMEAITPASERQEGGDHYLKLAIKPLEYSMANGLDPLQHTAIKYVTRFRDKDGIKDLRKAIHCIELLIEHETKGTKL